MKSLAEGENLFSLEDKGSGPTPISPYIISS